MFNPLRDNQKSHLRSKEVITDSYAIIPFHFLSKTTTVARIAGTLVYVNGCRTFTQHDLESVCDNWDVPEDVKNYAVDIAKKFTKDINFEDLLVVVEDAPTLLDYYPDEAELTNEQRVQLYLSNSGTLQMFTKIPPSLAEQGIYRLNSDFVRMNHHAVVDNIHLQPHLFDPTKFTEEQLYRITVNYPFIWQNIENRNTYEWVKKNKKFLVLAVAIEPELAFNFPKYLRFQNYLTKVALKHCPSMILRLPPKFSYQMIALKAEPQLLLYESRLGAIIQFQFDDRVIAYARKNYAMEYTAEMLEKMDEILN